MIPTVYVYGTANVGKTALVCTCIDSTSACTSKTSDETKQYETPVVIFKEIPLDSPSVPQENEAQSVWFCVDGTRPDLGIHREEFNFIKELGGRVLIVVTKCELLNENQVKFVNETLLKYFLREQIVLVSAKEKSGLPVLIKKTKSVIMETGEKIGHGFLSYRFESQWDEFFSKHLRLWNQKNDEEANSYITWAAGRAAAIAIIPLPLADVGPLVANEIYMIYRLAGVYGVANDQSLITMILGCTGGSLAGKIGASLLPLLKIPIAAAVTYGVGKAAKAFFESGMELNGDTLKDVFEKAMDEASNLFW